MADPTVVILEPWRGDIDPADPDANFKADVALHAPLDPLSTIRVLSDATGIPVGGLCHYVLARWANAGSGGLLEIGPAMVQRLWSVIAGAEKANTDGARLAAYDQLRQMLSWLRSPLLSDGPETVEGGSS